LRQSLAISLSSWTIPRGKEEIRGTICKIEKP
jgi:hypothetical protein